MRAELRRTRREARARIEELREQIDTVERRRERKMDAIRRAYNAHRLSASGIQFIADHEGLRLRAYQDVAGVWTIGYGHTGTVDGRPVGAGMTITRDTALRLLTSDVEWAVDCVDDVITIPLNKNRLAALVSFTFNVGCGAFLGSDLRDVVGRKQHGQVREQLMRWVYAGGVRVEGLVNRRRDESDLYEKSV